MMKQLRIKLKSRRFLRFAQVGVLNTALDFALLNSILLVFGINDTQKLLTVSANIFSASCVSILSFLLNRSYVFKHDKHTSDQKLHHKLVLFVAITLSGLFIIQGITFALFLHGFEGQADALSNFLQNYNLHFATESFLVTNAAKASATLMSMLWNYSLYKRYVFQDKLPTANASTED